MENQLRCYRLSDDPRKKGERSASIPGKQSLVHQATSQKYQVSVMVNTNCSIYVYNWRQNKYAVIF